MPSGEPDVSRMNTGTSMVPPGDVAALPTVTTSAGGACAKTGTATIAPRSTAANRFIKPLFLSLRPRIMFDCRAADTQRAAGDRGLARAGGVAQQRERRIDADGDVAGRFDLDLR